MIIVIEGKKINSEQDFHQIIAEKLEFPDYYGKNLDALRDFFVDYIISYPDELITLVWQDHKNSQQAIGDKNFQKILKILSEAKNRWKKDFTVDLC